MINLLDLKKLNGFKELVNTNLSEDFDVDISTDTRSIVENQTFLGIEGEKFKPLSFLEKITDTKLVICEDNEFNRKLSKIFKEKSYVFVENSIKYLQNIGTFISKKFINSGGSIIAICGSNGKTTTKEMLFHIMKNNNDNIVCTQKNNNNHIGVPLTLLNIKSSTQYCILELGSNHPGEIKTLCEIAQPNIGVTTNIGDTHLEFFGSRAEVFKDEGFLYHWIKDSSYKNKKFFLNNDDEFLNSLPKNDSFVVSYGKMGDDYKLHCTSSSGQVDLNGVKYVLANECVTGEHNFFNLCLATIISKELMGGEISKFSGYANSFRPTTNRSEWISLTNSKVFLDAYNANPSSMEVAIKAFCEKMLDESVPNNESVLILGDMNELGEDSSNFHEKIGSFLKEQKINNAIFVGRFASDYNKGFENKGFEFNSVSDLVEKMPNILNKYKRIFIKGSRSLQLESILDI